LDQSKFAGRTSRPQGPAELKWLARFWHLHFRLVLSTAFGTAVTLTLLALPWRTATRLLVGWDSGVVLYLALIYWYMAHASVARMRQRAAIDDEGAIALLVLTTTAALASLAAVVDRTGAGPVLRTRRAGHEHNSAVLDFHAFGLRPALCTRVLLQGL